MTRLEKILVHGGTLATGVTGLAYAAFKHLMTSDDPFTAYNHPLQPWMLTLHVLAAPVLVFGMGTLFKDHVLEKMRSGAPRGARRGGLWTLVMAAGLILTGSLAQVLASGAVRSGTAWIHLALGGAFLLVYGLHLATGRRLKAERERQGNALPLEAPADTGAGLRDRPAPVQLRRARPRAGRIAAR